MSDLTHIVKQLLKICVILIFWICNRNVANEETTSKKARIENSKAYSRFKLHYWRTENLLDAGISGLEENRKPIENLLEKFGDAQMPRGRIPKGYKPTVKKLKSDDINQHTFAFDDRSAALIKNVIATQLEDYKKLNYHHHSILAVSIWGSYETYIYMLFEELFSKQPRMLKTNEFISYSDAFEHKDDIEKYLSEKSLEKLGQFSLKESLSYLSEKINFKYSRQRERNLHQIYLIRNIIAHNSGILRPGQEKQIPKDLTVKNRELRISRTYLKRIHSIINASVAIIEKHAVLKFFKSSI